jgi:hypothetical protein
MSTAGKVLVVLILLVLPVWILLVSAVAQLNMEWTQALAKQAKQVETLTASVTKNEQAIADLQTQITLSQLASQEQQAVLQSKLADVERARAETIEIQTAVKVQIETLAQAVAKAELARDERQKEQQRETEGLAAARTSVDELKSANSELLAQLTQLRTEFKELLDSNKGAVERVLRSRTLRTGRSVSFIR